MWECNEAYMSFGRTPCAVIIKLNMCFSAALVCNTVVTVAGPVTGRSSLPSSSQVVCVKEPAKQTVETYSTVGKLLRLCVCGMHACSVLVQPVSWIMSSRIKCNNVPVKIQSQTWTAALHHALLSPQSCSSCSTVDLTVAGKCLILPTSSAGNVIHCTGWQVKVKLILAELKSSPWLLDICFCLSVFSAWRLGCGFETWLRLWTEILVAGFRKSHLFYLPLSCCIIRGWSSLLARDI